MVLLRNCFQHFTQNSTLGFVNVVNEKQISFFLRLRLSLLVKKLSMNSVVNHIPFPIFTRKEVEAKKLEKKSKQ